MLIFDSNKGCALVVVPFHVDQVSLSFQFLNFTLWNALILTDEYIYWREFMFSIDIIYYRPSMSIHMKARL